LYNADKDSFGDRSQNEDSSDAEFDNDSQDNEGKDTENQHVNKTGDSQSEQILIAQ
jgi:hypothetical protein